jgi:cytochrome c oxidase subunit 2
MKDATFWMPPQASTLAPDIDFIFYFIYWVDVAFLVALIGAMLLFAVQYRQKSENDKTHPTQGSHKLEFIWAFVPTLLSIAMFVMGFQVYIDSSVPPADSMDVRVIGQKWSWSYDYGNGVVTNKLKVPAGQNVRLTMNSRDTLHSFYVPDFRIKKDVLPNRYTVLWFNAPEPGEHQVFCTEYCGDSHSTMLSSVEVMEPAAYEGWMAYEEEASKSLTGAALGEKLFKQNCVACHGLDGNKLVGPPLNGIYGKNENLADGSTVLVDDNYLRESITMPAAKIVAGYPPAMTPFAHLTDTEVDGLIDYLKGVE